MLQKQEEHLIKIKRQAIVHKGTLRYIPLPDRLDSRRKRDIFNRLGKNRECFSSSSGMRTPEFPQVLGCGNLEKCSKQALLQRSVAAEKKRVLGFMPDEKMKEGCDCDDSRN